MCENNLLLNGKNAWNNHQKSRQLEGRFVLTNPFLHKSLGLKLCCIFAPQPLHSTHRIKAYIHSVTFPQPCPIRESIIFNGNSYILDQIEIKLMYYKLLDFHVIFFWIPFHDASFNNRCRYRSSYKGHRRV